MAKSSTNALKVSVVVPIHNGLLKEMERILIRESATPSEAEKKFQVKARALQCSGKMSAKEMEEKMKNVLEFLQSIEPRSNVLFEMKPPPTKAKPPKMLTRWSPPKKLSSDRLALNITHTVANTKAIQLNPTGRAIPLCLPNDCKWDSATRRCMKLKGVTRSTLTVCKEAVEILKKISGPVCVVAVVGPCRTGKSYILTRLITAGANEQCTTCFKLGHKMDPETMGIWMWDSPFVYKLKNGMEVTIVLLDTEGIDAFNATERGDNQIFTLSVLLSSLLIYNSLSVPKRDDLQNMQFVASLATSIVSKGKKQLTRSQLAQVSPGFLWLLRDVILEPTSACGKPCHIRDFLLEKVLSPGDDEDIDDESTQAKTSKIILKFFSSFDAETIPPPSTNPHVMKNIEDPRYQKDLSPDFLNQIDFVRHKIFDRCQPKRGFVEGSLVSGIQLAHMLEQYVEALNSPDGVPEVGTTWERVVQNTYAIATTRAKDEYQAKMTLVKFPQSFASLMDAHSDAYDKAISTFNKFTEVDSERDIYNTALEEMTSSIATYAPDGQCNGGMLLEYIKSNEAISEARCQELLKDLKKQHLIPILDSLSSTSSISAIAEAMELIYTKFEESAVGPGKEKACQEFENELKDDKKRYEKQLKLLKDCDEHAQKLQEEIQEQQLISIKQQKKKEALEVQMKHAKLENTRKLAAMEEKIKETQDRADKERMCTVKNYEKQLTSLEKARASAQDIIETQKELLKQQEALSTREQVIRRERNRIQQELWELKEEIRKYRNQKPKVVYYRTGVCAIQ